MPSKDTQLNIRIQRELAKEAKKAAKKQKKSLSEVIRDLLSVWLGKGQPDA